MSKLPEGIIAKDGATLELTESELIEVVVCIVRCNWAGDLPEEEKKIAQGIFKKVAEATDTVLTLEGATEVFSEARPGLPWFRGRRG